MMSPQETAELRAELLPECITRRRNFERLRPSPLREILLRGMAAAAKSRVTRPRTQRPDGTAAETC